MRSLRVRGLLIRSLTSLQTSNWSCRFCYTQFSTNYNENGCNRITMFFNSDLLGLLRKAKEKMLYGFGTTYLRIYKDDDMENTESRERRPSTLWKRWCCYFICQWWNPISPWLFGDNKSGLNCRTPSNSYRALSVLNVMIVQRPSLRTRPRQQSSEPFKTRVYILVMDSIKAFILSNIPWSYVRGRMRILRSSVVQT